MSARWTFTPDHGQARRDPPLSHPAQLEALRELLLDVGQSRLTFREFADEDWPELLSRRNDPDAESVGNGISVRVSGDEVIFTALYDQWDDAGYVYVPVAVVQELLDQFGAYLHALK